MLFRSSVCISNWHDGVWDRCAADVQVSAWVETKLNLIACDHSVKIKINGTNRLNAVGR